MRVVIEVRWSGITDDIRFVNKTYGGSSRYVKVDIVG